MRGSFALFIKSKPSPKERLALLKLTPPIQLDRNKIFLFPRTNTANLVSVDFGITAMGEITPGEHNLDKIESGREVFLIPRIFSISRTVIDGFTERKKLDSLLIKIFFC